MSSSISGGHPAHRSPANTVNRALAHFDQQEQKQEQKPQDTNPFIADGIRMIDAKRRCCDCQSAYPLDKLKIITQGEANFMVCPKCAQKYYKLFIC